MKSWKIRALRFDLPLLAGTDEKIASLIAFAKEWNFNTLVLHFEGVIRTRSLRRLATESTYAPDRITRIVDRARNAGLEIIPVVGTLGHAEHLVEGPELRPLLQDGARHKHLFCPSQASSYEIMDDYFTELAALFPGQDIHIGGDESWALGACPVCRERLNQGESPEGIVLGHLLHLNLILNRLGKRTWIWDDVFQRGATEKAAALPRDVVICSWRVPAPTATRRSPFHDYLEMGFDVVACPWARSIDNIARMSEVPRREELHGGMVTVWNLSTTFWPVFLPGVAFAGMLWARPGREADVVLYEALRKLLPSLSQEAVYAVCGVLSNPFWNVRPSRLDEKASLDQQRHLLNFVLYEGVLHRALRSMPTGLERSIVAELHTHIALQIRAGRKRGLLQEPPAVPEDPPLEPNEEDWRIPTPRDAGRKVSPYPSKPKEPFAADVPATGRALLTVRLSLATSGHEPTLRIELGSDGGWKEVYLGTFKPFNAYISVYNFQLPMSWKTRPDRIRFTVEGAGGDGILYAWASLPDRTLRLRSLESSPPPGSHAEAVLIDPAGEEIHGYPTLLHKGADPSVPDLAVVEMVLE